MSHSKDWQNLFPAVQADSQRIFLNNRYGTQIPDSIIQGIAHALSTGIIWNTDDGAEELRHRLAAFLHVDDPDTFFFTESEAGLMHWLACSWCSTQFQDGDEEIFSRYDAPMIKGTFDHIHQLSGLSLRLKEFGYKENGEFDLNGLLSQFSAKTRLIFVPHIHPVFGTKNEDDIAFLKQQVGDQALVVVDISQSVGRIPVYLERLCCDCAFFSARNLFSPFHSGIAYIRHRPCSDTFLQHAPVSPLTTQALTQGIDLLEHIGMEQIALHLQDLSRYLLQRLQQIPHIEFLPGIGRCRTWCSPGYGILSFRLPGISVEECIMPLAENAVFVDRADIAASQEAITVNLHLYNTRQHIDALVDCLQQFCGK
jgi:selenocysteine lyase/cysteine desulfurase